MSRREILSFLVLGLYLVALLRPVMPCLEYHFKQAYIVEKLCTQLVPNCAGQCYLSQQLNEAHNAGSPQALLFSTGDVFIIPRPFSYLLFSPLTDARSCLIPKTKHGLTSDYCGDIFRPPISRILFR